MQKKAEETMMTKKKKTESQPEATTLCVKNLNVKTTAKIKIKAAKQMQAASL